MKKIILRSLACVLMLSVLMFCASAGWVGLLWGVNLLALLPEFIVVVGITFGIAWVLWRGRMPGFSN